MKATTNFEKQLNKEIKAIGKAVKSLRLMGLTVEIAKDVETMMGKCVDHVYIVDRVGQRIILQKHLFTV